MDSYDIQKFLHIGAAIVGLGAVFALPFAQAMGERKGVGGTRFALELGDRLEKFLIIPGSIIVLLVGVGLIFDDTKGYSDDFPAWLGVSIVWFVVAFGAALFLQGRNRRNALEALEGLPDDADLPEAYGPVGKLMQIVGGLLGLSIIGIALLMVWQP